MIDSIGQVMLYVGDIESAAVFWKEKMGFERVEKQVQGTQVSYIVAPKAQSDVQFVLHDKAQVAEMNPDMNLETPSILMAAVNLEETYQKLAAKGVAVHPILDLGFMKVFNFADNEGHYFAVRELKHDGF
ncbi:VOC family protein [Streptococcus panodentis]|uniref:Glyoxalase/bleomycin resistance/extradiol dioxygenase family protein n=1 Tax=Streptococcus panodentis TaxID=1581472 RepID=A0ABS5AYL1_9STRE|nr:MULTISPECIES: VOC family protein [Streptococcus]KXT82422.1 Lactoylglutathione lyase or related lyase [Streptococcus sp. DD11]MBP2621670.1 glyoxalase/bleomycin resistance/extradiol dioxygenase family protein [Streptococcus panodentis]